MSGDITRRGRIVSVTTDGAGIRSALVAMDGNYGESPCSVRIPVDASISDGIRPSQGGEWVEVKQRAKPGGGHHRWEVTKGEAFAAAPDGAATAWLPYNIGDVTADVPRRFPIPKGMTFVNAYADVDNEDGSPTFAVRINGTQIGSDVVVAEPEDAVSLGPVVTLRGAQLKVTVENPDTATGSALVVIGYY